MERLFQAYQLALVVAFFVSASVAAFAWQRRNETGAKPLFVLLVGEMIWTVAGFLAVYHRGSSEALFYSKFWYPGVNLAVIGFFLLALEYTGRSEYITPRLLALLSIEPVVFNAVVWVDESLVWALNGQSANTLNRHVVHQGPAFLVHAVYSYILLAAGAVMIAKVVMNSRRLYRRQSLAILGGLFSGAVGNALFHILALPVDTTPIGFAVGGVVLGWAILNARFLDITPIARDTLVETLQDGVFVLDRDGHVVDINKKGREILGSDSHADGIGDSIRHVADDSVPVSQLLSLHRETNGKTREVTIHDRYYTIQTSPLYDIRDQFVGSVFLLHDITEQKRRQDELTAKNEQLDQFASVISHDLRNPLNVATGYAELARETQNDEYFDRIETAHDRMETLIEDLLALARENDQISERESLSLSTITREAWNNVRTEGATLDVSDEMTLRADPDRLQQLFENLFRNAVEHGGTDISVTVGSFDGGFFVADDGVGIDSDMRDRILETGVTTSEDGTGLGMDIVQNVVDAHGWELDVTDSAESGARFEIRGVESVGN